MASLPRIRGDWDLNKKCRISDRKLLRGEVPSFESASVDGGAWRVRCIRRRLRKPLKLRIVISLQTA